MILVLAVVSCYEKQATKVTIDEWDYIKIESSAQQISQQNEKPVYGISRNYLQTIYLMKG